MLHHRLLSPLKSALQRRGVRYESHWAKYERKSPVEHVLLRPGMYIGNTAWVREDQWVYCESKQRMLKQKISYSPALLKIFDEILVNAADNARRTSMKHIDISVTVDNGDNNKTCPLMSITTENDGSSIPVVRHEREGIYVPELIFGHLLTGSNFNDETDRLTGGSHGYGAKLTNIFSDSFAIDIHDPIHELQYRQQWSKNMSHISPAEITPLPPQSASKTSVHFTPDLSRFNISTQPEDRKEQLAGIVRMYQRRAFDVAACLNGSVSVTFNKALVPVNSFQEYCALFASPVEDGDSMETSMIQSIPVNNLWQMALLPSTTRAFESMSFVNSVWTVKGGTHVQAMLSQLVKVVESMLAKKGMLSVSPSTIRNNVMLIVNAQVPNPTFEGQSKDALLTVPTKFGSDIQLAKKMWAQAITQSGILDRIIADHNALEHSKLSALTANTKTAKKNMLMEVPKLEDAHFAGTDEALQCTLIVTEGDSAKALAVAGLSVLGREYFGVMPLRGKLLNVKAATKHQISTNEEISNLCKAMGLSFNNTYEGGLEDQGLRYGRIMFMCDQDHDGAHIKGLLINFFHRFWPSLLKREGFLQEFITPIVKVRSENRLLGSFFNLFDYEQWKVDNDFHAATGTIADRKRKTRIRVTTKYYKGLGTSTSEEAREYFSSIEQHRKLFVSTDFDADDQAIDLVFSKDKAKERKDWLLQSYSPSLQLDLSGTDRLSYTEFVDKELIHFSFSDNMRSIPSAIDGLKPSQRKVLFGCFGRFPSHSSNQECKVVQLAGYIAERSSYHHGEVSLHSTLVNMAQDFIGSNNIPLVEGVGQFGTRAKGGQDHASPRYIFAKLSPLARLLFPKVDDELLDYQEEDGQPVEPKYFVPIVPMLLVNGAHGIGTGWSTKIPCFNIMDIIQCLEERLQNEEVGSAYHWKPIIPWFRNFKGSITLDRNGEDYLSTGVIEKINRTTIEISELPVEKWTEDYKEYLYRLVDSGKIKGFKEYHGNDNVRFVITAPRSTLDKISEEKLADAFKLTSSINLSNMHAFGADDQIKKFHSPCEIMEDHFTVRMELYKRRKQLLTESLTRESLIANNKMKFVDAVIHGRLDIYQASIQGQEHLSIALRQHGLQSLADIESVISASAGTASVRLSPTSHDGHDFDYLLSMPLHSLSAANVDALQSQSERAGMKLMDLRQSTPAQLWLEDLSLLKAACAKANSLPSK